MKENYYVKTDCGCGCSWPDVFSCDVQYDKEKVHLNMLSLNKKYQFILNIENGIATVKKFSPIMTTKKLTIYAPNTKAIRKNRMLHAIIIP